MVGNSFAAAAIILACQAIKPYSIVFLGAVVRESPNDKFFRPLSYILFCPLWGVSAWMSFWSTLFVNKPPDFNEYEKTLRDKLNSDKSGRLQAIGAMGRASKADAAKYLTDVYKDIPLLAIYGDKDPDFPDAKKEAEWLTELLSTKCKASVLLYENVSHYPHVEMPEKVVADIFSFLTRAVETGKTA